MGDVRFERTVSRDGRAEDDGVTLEGMRRRGVDGSRGEAIVDMMGGKADTQSKRASKGL